MSRKKGEYPGLDLAVEALARGEDRGDVVMHLKPLVLCFLAHESRRLGVPDWEAAQSREDVLHEALVRLLTSTLPRVRRNADPRHMGSFLARSCLGIVRNELRKRRSAFARGAATTEGWLARREVPRPFEEEVDDRLDAEEEEGKVSARVAAYMRGRPSASKAVVERMIRMEVETEHEAV